VFVFVCFFSFFSFLVKSFSIVYFVVFAVILPFVVNKVYKSAIQIIIFIHRNDKTGSK